MAIACFGMGAAHATTHLLSLLEYRLQGSMEALTVEGTFPMDPVTHLTPVRFASTPGLWIGLAITAAFLGAAVRLRHYHGPIRY